MKRPIRALLAATLVASVTALSPTADSAKYGFRALDVQKGSKTVGIGIADKKAVKVACPQGTRPLSGGGWFHYPGEGPSQDVHDQAFITGQQPLSRGWLIVIYNEAAPGKLRFTGVVRCTARKLQTSSTSTSTVFPPNSTLEELTAPCPVGSQVYAASAWVARQRFGPPDVGVASIARVSSSFPVARQWYANAVNTTPETLFLELTAKCTTKLKEYDRSQEEDDLDEAPDEILRGAPVCPAGTKVVGGGAHFTENGVLDPTIAGRVAISSDSGYTKGHAGWFAYGSATELAGEDIDLRVDAVCLPN